MKNVLAIKKEWSEKAMVWWFPITTEWYEIDILTSATSQRKGKENFIIEGSSWQGEK